MAINRERMQEIVESMENWDDPIGASIDRHEVQEIASALLALDWSPITPENLPKVGEHEIGFYVAGEWLVSACRKNHTFSHYHNGGGTHFRAINAPERKGERSHDD